ncbi:hypothetical protein LUZ63_008486 [Rhynchospora breviuscula]|uniref:chitinase n=1 Tax=Rhynchospora breviuscula TaxID=2022672 RepID=A0A9Q0HVE7_9POAL|nr:hypothetical protein LUZ63_008486 [Rhynchospora breviuscula]
MGMRAKVTTLLVIVVAAAAVVALLVLRAATDEVKGKDKNEKICNAGWECSGSKYCCNQTISKLFQVYQFEELFKKRNSPIAHAVGFWDYHSFITAASVFEPLGFGTTGGKMMQMKEIAAFFGHIGAKTTCGDMVVDGGPFAWGLCYNHEMSPKQDYCAKDEKYPCVDGADYYGRGAIPVYWNYNYGRIGDGLKVDLLHHPEYLEQNATLAFMASMWQWMTPVKEKQPSAHDAFVGNWKPTKNDTAEKRLPGFGATMNILYGDIICGNGYIDAMNNIVSFYQNYLDEMGVGREHSGDNLDCAEQKPFNPSAPSTTPSSSS